jgi:hypothetical protein
VQGSREGSWGGSREVSGQGFLLRLSAVLGAAGKAKEQVKRRTSGSTGAFVSSKKLPQ